MAWIESHQGLPRHRKTKRFARKLGISIPTAIGHLHLLWWWAMDNLPDGSLSDVESEDIADEMMWDGDPEIMMAALQESGFIDQLDNNGLYIHDWYDYIGRLLEKRKQDAERKRKIRGRSRGQAEDVHGMSSGQDADAPQDGARNRTVPNLTNNKYVLGENQHQEKLRLLATELRIKGLGIAGLETIWSYIGQLDLEVIERALKMAEGRHVNYFVSIINGFIADGKTTVDSLNTTPPVRPNRAKTKDEQNKEILRKRMEALQNDGRTDGEAFSDNLHGLPEFNPDGGKG